MPTYKKPPSKGLRLGLFAKLMLAFLALIIGGAILTTWLARRATVEEFVVFTTETGRRQAAALAPLLAAYYQENGAWVDVQTALVESGGLGQPLAGHMGQMMGNQQGRGRMGQMMAGTDFWQMMGARVLVTDAGGQIVADTAGEMLGSSLTGDALTDGVTVEIEGRPVGMVLVTAGVISADQNDQFLDQVDRAILLSTLTAALIALVIGGLIAWRISRPVRQLTDAAQAIAAGDLATRVEVKPGDEIGDLAQAFNQMAAQLGRSEALRRQMTADIAHELRTPISVIQGNVEALQDGIFPLTLAGLDPIHDKTLLLNRLVEDLRQLSLAEAGQLPLDRGPVDLAALVATSVEGFRAAAEVKAVKLSLAPAAGLPLVEIDAQRIEQVLGNLLSNALRHTPASGQIALELAQDGDFVTVNIQDSGPGIPAEALPYVFERFYRVDAGRAREVDGGGTGLGLAVAQSIVQAHGGRIGVLSPPGQGARFWFSLPAARPA